MHNVLRVFIRDVRRIAAVPFAALLIVASCAMPGLYSWLNVAANMDPYSLTGNVPIAVTNNDEGATVQGQEINIGRQTEDALKENHDLGWRFVDEREAIAGVESGDYYAAIVIPKDFSRDLTSVMGGTIVRPQLDFYVNEKANSLSPRVAQSGANAIEQQINDAFVSTVSGTATRAMAEAASKASGGLDDASGQLSGKLDEARGSIADARTKIAQAQASIDASRDTIASARAGMTTLATRADALTGGIGDVSASIATARQGLAAFQQDTGTLIMNSQSAAGTLTGNINGAIADANGNAAAAATKTDALLSTLETANDAMGDAIAALESNPELAGSDALADAKARQAELAARIDAVTRLNDALPGALQAGGDRISATLGDLTAKANGLSATAADANTKANAGLDGVSSTLTTLAATVGGASQQINQLDSGLAQLDQTLGTAKDVMDRTDAALAGADGEIARTQTDFQTLRTGEAWKSIQKLSGADSERISSFLASPVELESEEYYPVKNYGSSVAPFFTNVACWVGSFVALTLFRHDADSDGVEGLTAKQALLGRWLLLMPVAGLQGLVISSGNLLLGIQCVVPWAYILGTVICSMTYVSLVYGIVMLLRHLGMALSVILIILQVPGAGGMYPIEMMPAFYQRLYPVLPFTYGVNALREAIGGFHGDDYWGFLARTALFAAVAIALAAMARPALANLNELFNSELEDTELIKASRHEVVGAEHNVMRTVRKAMGDPTWGEAVRRRAERFERLYPRLVRVGFHLVWAIPVLFLAVMMVTGPRIGFLAAWLAAVLAIDAALIVIEYLHQNLPRQARESALDQRDLLRSIAAIVHAGQVAATNAVAGAAGTAENAARTGRTDRTDGRETR